MSSFSIAPSRPGPSRVLGIDYGRKRVGLAISDPSRTLASPLELYERTSAPRDRKHFQELVRDERIERIVVGLPVHASGAESELSSEARAWGSEIAAACGCPVVFQDERYSSKEADNLIREAGLNPRHYRAKRDVLAAQILLQAYLDAGCPDQALAPQPLDDTP